MTLVYEEMRRAIEAAAPDRLALVASAMGQAYGAGGLTDGEYELLDGLLAARRRVAQAAPVRMQTLATACAQLVPTAFSSPGEEGAAPTRAHARTGSRPRSPESLARRRRWSAAGYLPPKIAAGFTGGEQAVLAVVGRELAAKGCCTLAVGHIAALAGVGASTVHRAMRQAALVGLVAVELRRVTGFRNDTNKVTLASREWGAWLRTRLPRSARADLGGAYQFAHSTWVDVENRERQARTGAAQGPTATPWRTTWPARRTADA